MYGREAHRPDASVLAAKRPLAVFCVGRARKTAVEALGTDRAAERLEAGNVLAKEVRRIRIMDEVIDLVAGTCRRDEGAASRKLALSAPCFALWLAQDGPLDEAVAAVVHAVAGSGSAVHELG